MYFSQHWVPSAEVIGRVCPWDSKPPVAVAPVAPAVAAEGFDGGREPPLPLPVRTPTVIVWSSNQCAACRSSAPTFRALERNASGWTVVHIEATADVLRRYPGHLISLPTYDFLFPEPGMHAHTNALGIPDVRLRTVRINSPEVLRSIVPTLTL